MKITSVKAANNIIYSNQSMHKKHNLTMLQHSVKMDYRDKKRIKFIIIGKCAQCVYIGHNAMKWQCSAHNSGAKVVIIF